MSAEADRKRRGFLNRRWNRATFWFGVLLLFTVLLAAHLFAGQIRVQEVLLVFISVPRLHDLGRSGWWVLVGLAVEAAGVVGFMMLPPAMAAMAANASLLVLLGLMIWLGATPGQAGENRFGPPPGPGLRGRPKKPAEKAAAD